MPSVRVGFATHRIGVGVVVGPYGPWVRPMEELSVPQLACGGRNEITGAIGGGGA